MYNLAPKMNASKTTSAQYIMLGDILHEKPGLKTGGKHHVGKLKYI